MGAPLKRNPIFSRHGEDRFIAVMTDAGQIFAAFSENGVSLVHPAESADQFASMFTARFGRIARQDDPSEHPALVDALRCEDVRPPECDLDSVSPFTRRVLEAAAQIERGETRTYQWLARQIGMPRASRAVGNALGANPVPILIPCHRVVRGDGSLGGYAFGSAMKRTLLEVEGALPVAA